MKKKEADAVPNTLWKTLRTLFGKKREAALPDWLKNLRTSFENPPPPEKPPAKDALPEKKAAVKGALPPEKTENRDKPLSRKMPESLRHPVLPERFADEWTTGDPVMNSAVWAAWVQRFRSDLERGGLELSVKDVDVLFKSAEEAAWPSASGKRDAGKDRRASRTIFDELFDFNTGPLNQRERLPVAEQAAEIQELADVIGCLGPAVQGVFAEPRDQLLDSWAWDVAHGDIAGVFGLAGQRGSGKSSVLYRIEQYAWRWLKTHPWRPLLIRFDLGTKFEGPKFQIGLMQEICRAVEQHCTRRPFVSEHGFVAPVVRSTRALLGRMGRWAQVNRSWALAVAFLSMLSLAITQPREEERKKREPEKKTGSVATEQASPKTNIEEKPSLETPGIFAESRTASNVALAGSIALLLMGTTHALQRQICRVRMRGRRTLPARNAVADGLLVLFAFGTFALATCTLAPVCEWKWTFFEKFPSPEKAWGCWLLAFCAAQFLLPHWWLTVTHCRTTLEALLGKDGAGRPEMGPLAGLGKLFDALLPTSAYAPNLHTMDAPFVEQEVKHLLRECVTGFGRVVILIDDVDVLPGDAFHLLLRALRPLTKCSDVATFVCVPRFFFDAWRLPGYNDLHSTMRDVFLVGDPARFPADTLRYAPPSLDDFIIQVENVFRRRMLVPMVSPDQPDGRPLSATMPEAISKIAKLWHTRFSGAEQRKVFDGWVERTRPTLREIIRETHRLILAQEGRFLHRAADSKAARKEFDDHKKEYKESETLLDVTPSRPPRPPRDTPPPA